MTGEASWLTLALILGGALVIVALGFHASRVARAGSHRHFERRSLVCPKSGRLVDGSIVREDEGGEVVRVAYCPLEPDPLHPTCDEACIGRQAPAKDV